jgi:site-specific recombinase XerD
MTWQVHFTQRRLPWPAEPRPLLAQWEPEDLAAWLKAEGIIDGLPFLLDPDGRYDVALNRYFLDLELAAAADNTQRAHAHDLKNFLTFLWCNRRQAGWQDATSEDRAAYLRWRRRDPDGPHVEGTTWAREVATVNRFYRWAVRQGLVVGSPIVQRQSRDRGRDGRRGRGGEAQTPAEHPHDARRHKVSWLPPASYRRWRDVGVRGYRPDGLADRSFRGRNASRNQAFCDLMLRTGLRLAEQTSLTRFELPDLDPTRMQVPFWLPRAVAKWGSERWVYVPAGVLGAVWDYLALERAEAVERAQAAGVYERLDDVLLVEDPSRPGVRIGKTWVTVAKLDPEERARLLIATPQGLEPAMLWLREDGLPTTTKAWQGVFRDASARCVGQGVRLRASPHVLRHSFAVIALERLQRGHLRDLERMHPEARRSYQMVFGDPLRWVSIRLGHASTQTTLKYLHTLAELELETKLALVPDDGWEPLELHPDDLVAELAARQPGQDAATHIGAGIGDADEEDEGPGVAG